MNGKEFLSLVSLNAVEKSRLGWLGCSNTNICVTKQCKNLETIIGVGKTTD